MAAPVNETHREGFIPLQVGADDQRGTDQSAGFFTKERKALAAVALCWVIGGLIMYVSGLVEEGQGMFGGLTFVQSLYLQSQILTTVGYGDFTPQTTTGKAFTMLYVLISGCVIAGLISELMDYFVDNSEKGLLESVNAILDDGDPKTETFFERNKDVISAASVFASVVLVWALFMVFFCDHLDIPLEDFHGLSEEEELDFSVCTVKKACKCEGRTFVDGIYSAIITLTTVGFGDMTMRTPEGEVFATLWMLVGVATYLNLVSAITDRIMRAKQDMRLETISKEQIDMADASGDGQVDLFEFTKFILVHFGIVPAEILDTIKTNFNDLDADGSGNLSARDIELLCSKKLNRRERQDRKAAVDSPGGQAYAPLAPLAEDNRN